DGLCQKQEGLPRLHHRGDLRGRHRAHGPRGQVDPRGPGQPQGELRPGARRGGVPDRGAHLALRERHAPRPAPDARPQAAPAPQGDRPPHRQDADRGQHPRAAQALLQERQRQAPDRGGQPQARVRQAPRHRPQDRRTRHAACRQGEPAPL
ncbi:MAG: tmRNA-binding protein SmpB, partial [uncultured Rubrobacteraceae bacterium]